MKEINHILSWAKTPFPEISAVHIPSVDNGKKCYLIRHHLDQEEWFLHTDKYNLIFKKWETPDVDILAYKYNKLLLFVARIGAPLALDALIIH